MALLIDLAATHATGRATRSRIACRCTACRSSRHPSLADSSECQINMPLVVCSSSPRWRLPFPPRSTATYGAMISHCSLQSSSARCGDALSSIDARLPSPMCRGLKSVGSCAAGCHAAVAQDCTTIGHETTSRQGSISTHAAANPATDVSSTLLGPVDP
jgi:hypothetical protein